MRALRGVMKYYAPNKNKNGGINDSKHKLVPTPSRPAK